MSPEKEEKKPVTKRKLSAKIGSIGGFLTSVFITALFTTAIVSQVLEERHSENIAVLSTVFNKNTKEKDKMHAKSMKQFARDYEADEKEVFRRNLLGAIRKLQPKLDMTIAEKIVKHLIEETTKRNIDPILIAGLMYEESMFNPMAHSKKGAVGLMQVRYSTWKKQSVLLDNGVSAKSKLYWIDLNIKCGVEIFANYLKKADYNVVRALHQYNSGSPKLPSSKKRHEISYVNKVLITTHKIRTIVENRTEQKLDEHNSQ